MGKHFPPPILVRSLDGSEAVKLYLYNHRKVLIDPQTIVGVMEPEEEDQNEFKSLLITSWGILRTGYSVDDLAAFLYPVDVTNYD